MNKYRVNFTSLPTHRFTNVINRRTIISKLYLYVLIAKKIALKHSFSFSVRRLFDLI